MSIKKTGLLIIALSLFFMAPVISQAAEDGEMAIYPANWDGKNEYTKYWYIYNLDKGEEYNDQVVIENTGDNSLQAKIYPVDALTTSDGAFALENEDEPRDEIGQWVHLSENEVDLQPGEKKTIDFTFKVPADASVGEHIGGIIVENKQMKSGKQINLKTRVGVRIYETIPGEIIKKIEVADLQAKGYFNNIWSLFYNYQVQYNLVNQGNVQVKPKVEMELTSDWFGSATKEEKETNGSIFPGKQISFEHQIDKNLWIGPYKVLITVNQEGAAPVQISHTFWVWPWKLIVLGILLLVGLISWIYTIFNNQNEVEEFWLEEKEPEKIKVNTKKEVKNKKQTKNTNTKKVKSRTVKSKKK